MNKTAIGLKITAFIAIYLVAIVQSYEDHTFHPLKRGHLSNEDTKIFHSVIIIVGVA